MVASSQLHLRPKPGILKFIYSHKLAFKIIMTVTIHPYFDIDEGKMEEFKAIWTNILPTVRNEAKCAYYEFTFKGNTAMCREGYEDADGVLTHLGNVDASLKQALTVSKLTRLEIHGPSAEVDKLREPLSHLPVDFFIVEFGFASK